MTDFFQLGNLHSNSVLYFGVLLRDEDGVLSTRVIQGAGWRDELLGKVGQVRALVIGMGELARANLAAVMPLLQQAQEALESDVALTTLLPPRPDGYVYLYFSDTEPSWRNGFYIGMSESDPERRTSHLRSFLKGRREVRSPKTFEIDRALKALEDKLGQQIGSMKRYREVADSSGGSHLFKHTFTGLTPLQAFIHGAAMFCDAHTQSLLEVVIEVADRDASHGVAPAMKRA